MTVNKVRFSGLAVYVVLVRGPWLVAHGTYTGGKRKLALRVSRLGTTSSILSSTFSSSTLLGGGIGALCLCLLFPLKVGFVPGLIFGAILSLLLLLLVNVGDPLPDTLALK